MVVDETGVDEPGINQWNQCS